MRIGNELGLETRIERASGRTKAARDFAMGDGEGSKSGLGGRSDRRRGNRGYMVGNLCPEIGRPRDRIGMDGIQPYRTRCAKETKRSNSSHGKRLSLKLGVNANIIPYNFLWRVVPSRVVSKTLR